MISFTARICVKNFPPLIFKDHHHSSIHFLLLVGEKFAGGSFLLLMWLSPGTSLGTKGLVSQAKLPQGVNPECEHRGVLSCHAVSSEGDVWCSVQGVTSWTMKLWSQGRDLFVLCVQTGHLICWQLGPEPESRISGA